MPTIQIPETLPKVFAMSTPAHLMRKLWWEIGRLEKTLQTERNAFDGHLTAAYQAFNCAVTAWHMVDRVWESSSPELRSEIGSDMGINVENRGEFLQAIRTSCRAMSYCREIATGSKHKVVRRHADPNVVAALDWWYEDATVESSVDDPISTHRWALKVYDGNDSLEALAVFREAFKFWQRFLERWGFIEPHFIG